MTQSLSQKGRSAALKVVGIQFAVVFIASVAALFWGFNTSLSVFAGGMINVIPSLLFAIKVFQHSGAQAARQVMTGFYIGEAFKFLLAIVLFVIVLKWLPVSAAACLLGFVLAVLVQMTSPLMVMKAS